MAHVHPDRVNRLSSSSGQSVPARPESPPHQNGRAQAQPAARRRKGAPLTPSPPFQRDPPPHLDTDRRARLMPVHGLPPRPMPAPYTDFGNLPTGPRMRDALGPSPLSKPPRGRSRERSPPPRRKEDSPPPRRSRSPGYRRRDRDRERSPPRRSDRSPSPPRRRTDRSPSPPRRPHRSAAPSDVSDDRPPRRRRYTPSPSPRRSRSPPRRERRRSRSPSPARRRSRRSRSVSEDRPEDDSEEERKRRRKRRREKEKERDSETEDDSDEERRRKRRKRRERSRSRSEERKRSKKDKKDKKEKKDKKQTAATTEWGKYGTITEADMYTKDEEFRAWLVEERLLNPETLSKDAHKKEFARFVEDFNTATLPHEKYYDYTRYNARMSALRAGETLPDASGLYDPARDLADMRAARKKPVEEKESFLSTAELKELQRVERERTQIGKMKSLGLDIKPSMGVRMDAAGYSED